MKDQIKNMAKIIAVQRGYDCAAQGSCDVSCIVYKCSPYEYAEVLYNAGYRKQSEGEWKKVEEDLGGGVKTYRFACTNCGFLKNTLTGNFCPKCGAKMKGASDER